MSNLQAQIEALLFIKNETLTLAQLAKKTGATVPEVKEAITDLMTEKNIDESGIHILEANSGYRLVTNPGLQELVEQEIKSELNGELTRPQLETLTIVAYKGPASRAQLEQIRGVNCQAIIRNLMMRGLIDEQAGDLQPNYTISDQALALLGIHKVSELPRYAEFNQQKDLDDLLKALDEAI